MKEDLKELVSKDVYDKVTEAEATWKRGFRANEMLDNLEVAQGEMLNREVINGWYLKIQMGGMELIKFDQSDECSNEIWEAILQFLTLLEAIHYSERKQAIIDFNNSLKNLTNGSSSEK